MNATEARAYRVHGLTVSAPLFLGEYAEGATDLSIIQGPRRPVPPDAESMPDGEVLAELVDPARRVHYRFVRLPDGSYLLRWPGAVEFTLDASASCAVGVVDPDADPGLLDVLVKGALLAFVLLVRGHTVLHASAVETGGRAIALVGASGMGKSTLATMLCAGGARLLTDDVLRVDVLGDEAFVQRGVAETRLRPAAADLTELFPPEYRTRTADGREALRLPAAVESTVKLSSIVVPAPSRELTEMRAERLPAMEALLLLSRFPRFPGWQSAQVLGRAFQKLGDLVDQVPVTVLRVPWGPPFAPLAPEDVLRAAGIFE